MKRQTFFLAAMSIMAAFADMGQEAIVNVDLSRRPLNGLSWSWTEYNDTSVRLVANRNGDEFCITNWSAYLVLGGGASGCVYEGLQSGYNEFVFNVDASSMPTNGRYTVQIVGSQGRRSEEWARGNLRVNLNPAVNYMPTCWMGYQKVARLAALYVTWDDLMSSPSNRQELTNTVAAALNDVDIGELQVSIRGIIGDYVSSRTNPCVRVIKSNVPELPRYSDLAWDGVSSDPRVFWNSSIPAVLRLYGDTFETGELEITKDGGHTDIFTPTNFNGDVYFSSCPTNLESYVRFRMTNVNDDELQEIFIPIDD